MNYFIDSHCHMHDIEFFPREKRMDFVNRAFNNNVKKLIFIGTDHQDSLNARDFTEENGGASNGLFWAYGVHPSETEKFREESDFSINKPIAIGEVGLDYHYEPYDKAEQFKLFEEMISLAEKYDLPLIFHIREAFSDFFEIIDRHPSVRGVVHSFSDNKKNLQKVLDRGFYVGVNGMATYSTLPTPPLDRILLETDAPFLTPVPHRRETNESAFIPDVAKWLAEKLNVSVEEVMETTTKNCYDLFKFDKSA